MSSQPNTTSTSPDQTPLDTTPAHLGIKPDLKEESKSVIDQHVDGNITHLTLSALSSALGDIKVMKLTTTNKGSAKYVPVTDDQEIIFALQFIAKFSNTLITPAALEEGKQEVSYFILQQSAINMSAWNSLIDRRLGKIPQEAKIEGSLQFDLVSAGQKAFDASKAIPHDDITPVPTIPKIYTTSG